MLNTLRIPGASAAALAALALFVTPAALAQTPGPAKGVQLAQVNDRELAGAPEAYRADRDGRDRNDRNDRDRGRGDWRRPDFQTAQAVCSRAAIEDAWRRGAYSAQYNSQPRLVEGRYGWEMVGNMRVHSRKGYSYGDTVCRLRGDDVVQFEFLR